MTYNYSSCIIYTLCLLSVLVCLKYIIFYFMTSCFLFPAILAGAKETVDMDYAADLRVAEDKDGGRKLPSLDYVAPEIALSMYIYIYHIYLSISISPSLCYY